jgi:glucose dehydrogenase
MIFGGLQLVFLGGSFYYLLAGLVLVASAMKLWKADPMGSMVYGGLLVATVAWAFLESGTNLWALAPRILPLATIGYKVNGISYNNMWSQSFLAKKHQLFF